MCKTGMDVLPTHAPRFIEKLNPTVHSTDHPDRREQEEGILVKLRERLWPILGK